MDNIEERIKKLNELKCMLNEIDGKLFSLTNELNWDYKRLIEEKPENMVTCSINNQHRIPISKIKIHEEKCVWHHNGYTDYDKIFPEHSGCGSFVTLTPEIIHSITGTISSQVFLYLVLLLIVLGFQTNQEKTVKPVPQSSAKFDQNFTREEKLALYDYVIANTQKQIVYSDLWLQPFEKKEEKREMTSWEIAAAERDAKRRRASYRNKVHTNRKTHTEILREVIEAQMETLKQDTQDEKSSKTNERHKADNRKSSYESRHSDEKRKYFSERSSSHRDREERRRGKNHERHSYKHEDRSRKRSPSISGSDSRSRSNDKYRKRKTYKERSHSHKSSHSHRDY